MLWFWKKRSGPNLTVKDFVNKLYIWQKAAYISPDVWETVRKFVHNDVISENRPGTFSLFILDESENNNEYFSISTFL